MRIDILATQWDEAALALTAGNQATASTHERLVDRLAESAGMAGDDATSTEFAAAYDEGAATAVDALADLVDAHATLARLTRTSLDHHRHAERASVIGCRDPRTDVYGHGALPTARRGVTVLRRTPPGSRGGQSIDLPGQVQWVLDRVEGFVWPSADTDRLRAVGRAWTAASAEVHEISRHSGTAARMLVRQRSPEIPLAVSAVGNLYRAGGVLADQMRAIGLACTDYADDVDHHRAEIRHLVAELLASAVVVQGLGIVLGVASAGMTTAGAAAVNAARIAAAGPRILRIVETLALLARGGAVTLRLATSALRPVATTLGRMRIAEVLPFAARAAPPVSVGPINPAPLPPQPVGPQGEPIHLEAHERRGSHTLSKHVGKTDDELRDRLRREANPTVSSSFADLAAATAIVSTVLRMRSGEVRSWLKSRGNGRCQLDQALPTSTGRAVLRDGTAHAVSRVRVVLVKDPSMPDSFRVLTAYPAP